MVEIDKPGNRTLQECKGSGAASIGLVLTVLGIIALFTKEKSSLLVIFTGVVLIIFGYVQMKNDLKKYQELCWKGEIIYADVEKVEFGGKIFVEIKASYFDKEKCRIVSFKYAQCPMVVTNYCVYKLTSLKKIAVLTNDDYSKYHILVEDTLKKMQTSI